MIGIIGSNLRAAMTDGIGKRRVVVALPSAIGLATGGIEGKAGVPVDGRGLLEVAAWLLAVALEGARWGDRTEVAIGGIVPIGAFTDFADFKGMLGRRRDDDQVGIVQAGRPVEVAGTGAKADAQGRHNNLMAHRATANSTYYL